MRFRTFILPSAAALVLACGPSTASRADQPSPEDDKTRIDLVVENTTSYDMEIFLRHRGQAIPLGIAPGNRSTEFQLARAMVSPGQMVEFEARPRSAAAGVSPVLSEPYPLRQGEAVYFRITP